jgi:trimeric autotransporter adhesin
MLRHGVCILVFGVGLIGQCSAGLVLTGTSHTENFNGGLPANWSVRTGATASVLGTPVALGIGTWGLQTGQFFSSASVTGLAENTTTAAQGIAVDRALSIRQTGTFGDPGAAFVLEIENTTGFENFSLSLNAELQSNQPRTTTWQVDYGSGANPNVFTSIGNLNLGTTFGETANKLSFGNLLDNIAGPVWIRVATLTTASGTGVRDTFGIDDFNLNYSITAVPEPSSIALASLAGSFAWGMAYRRRMLHQLHAAQR